MEKLSPLESVKQKYRDLKWNDAAIDYLVGVVVNRMYNTRYEPFDALRRVVQSGEMKEEEIKDQVGVIIQTMKPEDAHHAVLTCPNLEFVGRNEVPERWDELEADELFNGPRAIAPKLLSKTQVIGGGPKPKIGLQNNKLGGKIWVTKAGGTFSSKPTPKATGKNVKMGGQKFNVERNISAYYESRRKIPREIEDPRDYDLSYDNEEIDYRPPNVRGKQEFKKEKAKLVDKSKVQTGLSGPEFGRVRGSEGWPLGRDKDDVLDFIQKKGGIFIHRKTKELYHYVPAYKPKRDARFTSIWFDYKNNSKVEAINAAGKMPNDLVDKCKKSWGVHVRKSDKPHTHPVSATERRLVVDKMLSIIKGNSFQCVMDVGGNPAHWIDHEEVWCCKPKLSPSDLIRRHTAAERGLHFCDHMMHQCTAIEHTRHADWDCLIGIHSLYYLSPISLARSLNKTISKSGYFAFHKFEGAKGSFAFGEAAWVNQEGIINMQVNGNSDVYTHGDLAWLRKGSFPSGHKYPGMAWTEVARVGETYIYKFIVDDTMPSVKSPISDRPIPMKSALASRSHYGPIEARWLFDKMAGYDVSYDKFEAEQVDVYSFGPHLSLKFFKPNTFITVPKEVVASVSLSLVNAPRNAATLRTATNRVQSGLQQANLLPSEMAKVAPYVVAMAFLYNLPENIQANETLITRVPEMKAYNDTLTLSPRSMFSYCSRALTRFYINRPPVTASVGSMVFSGTQWYKRLGKNSKVEIGTYCANFTGPFDLMDKTARVKYPHFMDCKPTFGARLDGIALRDRSPVVWRSCAHNELQAVANRHCVKVEYDQTEFRKFAQWAKYNFPNLFPHKHVKTTRAEWLARYDAKNQKRLAKAHHEYKAGIRTCNYNLSDAFIKREKNLVLTDDPCNHENIKQPRLIQGRHPAYQALTGPYILGASKALAKAWPLQFEENKISVVYATGCTPLQLGQQIDRAHKLFLPHTTIIENDGSSWDARFHDGMIELEMSFYDYLGGATPVIMAALRAQGWTVGATKHGVRYTIKATRKSGDNNTTTGNTLLNGLFHVKVAVEVLEVIKAVIFVLGDDNLMMCSVRLNQCMLAKMDTTLRNYGMLPKLYVKPTLFSAEFCSGRVYQTSKGPCFGPKIGKALSNIGWNVHRDLDGKAWARGVAIGLFKDYHFIPILRALMPRILHLTSGVQALDYQPYRYITKMDEIAEPVDETYVDIQLLYGVSKEECEEVEVLIDRADLGDQLYHPAISKILAIDVPVPYNTTVLMPNNDSPWQWTPTTASLNITAPFKLLMHVYKTFGTKVFFKAGYAVVREVVRMVWQCVPEIVREKLRILALCQTSMIIEETACAADRRMRFVIILAELIWHYGNGTIINYLASGMLLHCVCYFANPYYAFRIHAIYNSVMVLVGCIHPFGNGK